jgi:cell wall-associated NlpC family hydrolase
LAERAPTLSSRGWLQLGSLQIDLGTRTPGHSSVSLSRFIGSLATLAVIFVGLGGITPRRPLSASFATPSFPIAVDSAARPSLGPPVVAPPRAPEPLDPASLDASTELLPEASPLISLPAVAVDRSIGEATTLREAAKVLEVDASVLATFNGLEMEAADETLSKPELSLPLGLVEVGSLKLKSEPLPVQTVSYVIAPGDTLLDIAFRFGLEPETLAAANGLKNPDFIHPGDQLSLARWSAPAVAALPRAAPVPSTSVSAPVVSETATDTLASVNVASSEPAIATRPAAPTTYEVAEGDTVSVIAERFGVDTETIVVSNGLTSADKIRIGDELTILPISGVMHTVRDGQTLSEIAELYKVDLGPIIDFNYLDDADLITTGKDLLIPGGRPLPPPAPRVQTEYTVSTGDTLSSIAVRYGVTSGTISGANGLLNPDRLTVGVKLTIPGVSGPTQAAQQVVTRNLPVFTPTVTANLAPATGVGGDRLADYAMRFVGSRYVFGGTTPSGFDCSGFVYYVQANAGTSVSRGMWGQYSAGAHPARNQLQPGDIVFFQNTYMPGLSHNGIYIGGGQFVHASDERSGVKVSSLNEAYWSSRWFGATRVW